MPSVVSPRDITWPPNVIHVTFYLPPTPIASLPTATYRAPTYRCTHRHRSRCAWLRTRAMPPPGCNKRAYLSPPPALHSLPACHLYPYLTCSFICLPTSLSTPALPCRRLPVFTCLIPSSVPPATASPACLLCLPLSLPPHAATQVVCDEPPHARRAVRTVWWQYLWATLSPLCDVTTTMALLCLDGTTIT